VVCGLNGCKVLLVLSIALISPIIQVVDIELIKQKAMDKLKKYNCSKTPNSSLFYKNWCSQTL